MSIRVIKTKERRPYREQYHALLEKYFTGDFVSGHIPSWTDSPFLFVNVTLDEKDQVQSHCSMLLTNENSFKRLLDGELREHQIPPLQPGEYGMPYLYWPAMVLENRTHAPYLIKSIFGEVAQCVKDWELMITHVYSIAFTKVSERLMKRYYFKNAGIYKQGEHEYPIMVSKVSENPYLRAFIPQE